MLAIRSCRVCGCTNDRACPGGCYWLPNDDLCSACRPALDHVVSMTLQYAEGKPDRHVATCNCGWKEDAVRTPGGRIVLDKRIKRHWQEAVAGAQ